MGPNSNSGLPSLFELEGYVLGSLGYDKDRSSEYYQKQESYLKQRKIFRQNHPTPPGYDVSQDLDLLTLCSTH